MKKLLFLLIILSSCLLSQNVDTVINTGVYKSYFSKKLKEPLYVSYTLYKGGGDCDRSKFNFKNDTKLVTATQDDYDGTKTIRAIYDEGHLANAEDFAYDCDKDEKTFRFYNCLPQTPNLNRGIWKVWETSIREESKTDSLLIICGGSFKENRILGITKKQKLDKVAVPDHCWKLVISLTKKKALHILYFTNEIKNNKVEIITTIGQLEKYIGYKIVLK